MAMRLTLAVAAGDEHVRSGNPARRPALAAEIEAPRQLGEMDTQDGLVTPPLSRRGAVAGDAVTHGINHHRLPFLVAKKRA
jgi:hypothetical protein